MNSTARFDEIARLLRTALDDDEEYLYEGEMSNYARSYAVDAGGELRDLIEREPLAADELAYCAAELTVPRRLSESRSARVLELLDEQNRSLFGALARSADPQVRLWAVETAARHGVVYHRLKPLCRIIAEEPGLLSDPDEKVRLAAVAGSGWMRLNRFFLERVHESDLEHVVVRIYRGVIARLDDSSPAVRAAAAAALGAWAPEIARGALVSRLARETEPVVRAALEAAVADRSNDDDRN
jgi:hypothetical protein